MGRRRTRDAPIDIVLPITPMLDMSFQLLAFFVMTFRVLGPAEGELDMYLPRAGEAQAKVPDAVDLSKTSDADIDQASDLTVVIETANGDIGKLLGKDKAASQPEVDAPGRGAEQNRDEALAYDLLFLHARRMPTDVLRTAARRDLTFAHLFGPERAKYRGELVHVEGRLRLLRRYDPPESLPEDVE